MPFLPLSLISLRAFFGSAPSVCDLPAEKSVRRLFFCFSLGTFNLLVAQLMLDQHFSLVHRLQLLRVTSSSFRLQLAEHQTRAGKIPSFHVTPPLCRPYPRPMKRSHAQKPVSRLTAHPAPPPNALPERSRQRLQPAREQPVTLRSHLVLLCQS